MEPTFWLSSWKEGKRGFHLGAPHGHLVEHAPRLFDRKRVLVPLCGATHDLLWLAEHGMAAVGSELSPIAVEELVARDGLVHTGANHWERPGVDLFLGDFLELTPETVGPIDGIWDRAALVALHPSQRDAYVAQQRRLLCGGTLLLNTFSYDASKRDGPPWSVPHEEVLRLWPEAVLIHEEVGSAPPSFQDSGITAFSSQLFEAHVNHC